MTKGTASAPTASVSEDVLDAPDVVNRESDSYALSAFVWRDSMPLVVTGTPAMHCWTNTTSFSYVTLLILADTCNLPLLARERLGS